MKRYLDEQEISELKKVELELLDELDRVCKLLNIKYYMVGGTLLGAVRHEGFIPWDDDIDVVMYREDLDKLEKYGPDFFSNKYFLQTENTDKYYPLMTGKLRKNDTVFLEECMSPKVSSHTGIFIDIFPMDDISDINNKNIKRNVGIMKFITTLLSEMCGYHYGVKISVKVLSKIAKIFGISNLKKIRRKLMTLENGLNYNHTTIYASNYGYVKQYRNKNVYGKGVLLPFEGKRYIAPEKYEAFLSQLYGTNYMQLPPEDKRVTRHPISKLKF